ncbi:MAG: CHAT domain-containing protein [Zavarzinia sp.]|nr:CHAT domain-containing protein [Zavarzinia sp.]
MSRMRIDLGGLLALGLVLGGCVSGDSAEGPPPRDAGRNLVGETCTLREGRATGDGRNYAIHCGSWQQPAARLTESLNSATPIEAVSAGPWRGDIDSRMACGPARDATFARGLSGAIAYCRLRNGGFPTVALAIADGRGRLVLADGIPAAMPVIERGALAAFGLESLGDQTADSRAIELVRQSTGRQMVGAGVLEAYYTAMATAQYQDTIQDFVAAEDSYRKAMLAQAEALGTDDPASADPLMHVALELSNQGRFDDAAPLFDEAQRLAAAGPNPASLPRLLSYRAIDAANRNKLDLALSFAEQATEARRRLAQDLGGVPGQAGADADLLSFSGASVSSVSVEVAQSLHTEAALRLRLGDLAGAADKADEAIATAAASRTSPPWWRPQFLETRATIAAAAGNAGSAVAIQGEAVTLWARILPQSTPEGLSRLGLGRFLHTAGAEDKAIDSYRQGLAILKARNAEIRPRDLLGFLDAASAMATRRPEQAEGLKVEMFEAMQLMRSGVTSRTVSLATARLAAGDQAVSGVIRAQQENERKRYALVGELNRALSAPSELRDTAKIARLRQNLEAVETEGRGLDETLQAASSGYRQLLATPVGVTELQGLLKPGEAIAAFASAENATYGFLVAADRLKVWRIDAGDLALGDVVVTLRRGIQLNRGTPGRFPVDLAHQLHAALFGPVADDLAGIDNLVTTANGPLASIPFGILVASPASGRAPADDYRAVDWMVRHQALSAVPSVRAFADLRKVPTAAAGSSAMIGFGDYRPPRDVASLFAGLPAGCARDRKVLGSLGPLPATAGELRQVAGLVGAGADSLLLGPAFTKDAVLNRPLSDYRILYFATHAVLASEIRCFSEPALLVTPGAGGTVDSALLRLSDILNLKLDADLVVLSACNTAGTDGKSGGEALSGLTRAFFYAGARRLVVSHWPVPDDSTAALMLGLFDRRGPGVGGAAALREAQLRMIDGQSGGKGAAWAHPLYWAGFTTIGDGTGVIIP